MKLTVGTTASLPLPFVLVAAEAAPLLLLPALPLTLLFLLSLAARDPKTPPRTAPRITAIKTSAPTTQGHFFLPPVRVLPYELTKFACQ